MSAPKHTAALDTSGAVDCETRLIDNGADTTGVYLWSDLSPFTQGYIEALFAGAGLKDYRPGGDIDREWVDLGFSDLAPETLARIIADCGVLSGDAVSNDADRPDAGRIVWRMRQSGHWPLSFPPLTVQLGDDGKVRFQ